MDLFLTSTQLFASQLMNWSGVDYCDVFINCLDSRSDGTHSLQRIHWWAIDVMLPFSNFFSWWRNKLISGIWDGLMVTKFSVNKNVGVNFSFKAISTCVLANIWVDDTDRWDGVARILSVLESHFNLVVRSCYAGVRIPEPDIFTKALEKLGIKPQEVRAVNHFRSCPIGKSKFNSC